MPQSRLPENENTATTLVGVALAVFAAFALPLLLAAALFLPARRHLTWKEGSVLLATGLGGIIWQFETMSSAYFQWLVTLVVGPDRLVLPPLAPVGLLTLTFGGLLIILTCTHLGWFVIRNTPAEKLSIDYQQEAEDDVLGDTRIVPTPAERASIVATPGSLTDPQQHSILDGAETPFSDRHITLGTDASGEPVSLSTKELGRHVMLFGTTGSGKSVTIKTLVGSLMDIGMSGGIVLDLKEENGPGGLRAYCREYASHHAMPYQDFGLSDQQPNHWFNPLAGMGPDEMRDTILALQEFDEHYWQNINKKMLGQMVTLFYAAWQVAPEEFAYPSMYDMGKLLEKGAKMGHAAKKMLAIVTAETEYTREDFAAIHSPSKAETDSTVGFGAKIAQVYETQAGRRVLRAGDDKEMMDVTQTGLTYIGLDSSAKQDLSMIVSAAALQRLTVLSGQRTTGQVADRSPRFVIVDEGSVVSPRAIQALLNKARSANIMLIFATQSPTDLGEQLGPLLQNTNVLIAMKQNDQRSAIELAEFIGKDERYTRSQRYQDGEIVEAGTVRKEYDYLANPEDLKRLTQGEAIIKVGDPYRVKWCGVRMRDDDPEAR